MSDRVFAWLLRLYPPSFRREYADEALDLYQARLRDETGFLLRLRLCYDLLADLLVGLPQAYRNSYAAAAALPARSTDGVPSFGVLETEPLRPESILGGGALALTVLMALAFAVTCPSFLPVHPAKAPMSPVEFVMQRLNRVILPDSARSADREPVGFALKAAAGPQPQGAASVPIERKRPPAFEVISIRRNTGTSGPPQFGATPDGYHQINMPLFAIFQEAYAPPNGNGVLEGDRIAGGPEWLVGEHYDVVAKVSEADLADWQKPELKQAMLRAMLQSMLADRCKAVVHHESKEVPVYDLVVAKGGPKFKPAETSDATALKQKHPGGGSMIGGGMAAQRPNGTQFYGVSMTWLAETMLPHMAGRPVVDKTGLTGHYDLMLPPLALPPPPPPPGGRSMDAPYPLPTDDESIFTALPEALGLRLEPAKGQVDTLVIDHVERPSEN